MLLPIVIDERPGHRITENGWGWSCTCGRTFIAGTRFHQRAGLAAAREHINDTTGSLSRNNKEQDDD